MLQRVLVMMLFIGCHCAPPPNILFLMCDSMDGRVLDPTSPVSSYVKMPHLTKLANSGVNFVRTYAASPQCVPSRTTMFAGRHLHHTKTWNNGQGVAGVPSGGLDSTCVHFYGEEQCAAWAPQQEVKETLLDVMRGVGYATHLYGKVDVGAGIMQDSAEHNATATGFHSGPSLSILTRTADVRRPTKKDPRKITNEDDNHVHPEDWKMIAKCIDFLNTYGALSAEERTRSPPWMLYCSLNIPHPPFNTNSTWLKSVDTENVPAPVWPSNKSMMHPADSYMSQSKNVWADDFTPKQIADTRNTYFAMCAETDYMLGQVMKALEAAGGDDLNTITVFLSDHGEMNMEHRQVWKNSMYEPSSRVPMMIAGPSIPRGVTVQNLTSLLDVLPTLAVLGGGTAPSFAQGYSLLPFLRTNHTFEGASLADASSYPSSRFVVSQYHSNMGNTGSFMVRHGPWKYIAFGTNLPAFKDYTPQLFNLESDPSELKDVATAYPSVVKDLDAKLQSVVDYQTVDKAVKQQDRELYTKYFASKYSAQELRKKLDGTYTGFDDSDMAKVEAWLHAPL